MLHETGSLVGGLRSEAMLTGMIARVGTLTGRMTFEAGLTGSMVGAGFLVGRLSAESTLFGTVSIHNSGYAPYGGLYEVDPDFVGTVLQTSDKYMLDDVKVNPIKVESVSNLSGGRTVYIGGDVNYG